mmetsp:Transcript_33087/g.37564  ORF Transcript_33087/g.37564 Transcript_33087/m.37564 type:complete len:137 (-) Transcript_33087:205-615(-)
MPNSTLRCVQDKKNLNGYNNVPGDVLKSTDSQFVLISGAAIQSSNNVLTKSYPIVAIFDLLANDSNVETLTYTVTQTQLKIDPGNPNLQRVTQLTDFLLIRNKERSWPLRVFILMTNLLLQLQLEVSSWCSVFCPC